MSAGTAWSGELNVGDLAEDGVVKKVVRIGDGRLVRVDITEIVRSYLRTPSRNHGLVIGSLSGSQRGLFELREGFGNGVLGRITFYY